MDWIIVVDDDMTNLKMSGHILSKSGHRVSALKSGQAMLDFISANGLPDLILLDINMPGEITLFRQPNLKRSLKTPCFQGSFALVVTLL